MKGGCVRMYSRHPPETGVDVKNAPIREPGCRWYTLDLHGWALFVDATPPPFIVFRCNSDADQRPVISEPSTFSLSAFGPRVTATAPERTSSMMP